MHGLSHSNIVTKTKHQRAEEVSDLVSCYKKQRSFGIKNRSSACSSSSLGGLSSLNLPWDYNLDSNIVIKTEKDLEFDSRDFGLTVESDCPAQSVSTKEHFQWYKMQNMHTGEKNAVSFASMMTDSSSYEEQYLGLKIFLAACSTSYKRELSGILFPLFVHFYLDLISKPDNTAAQAFYTKFHHDHEDNHKEMLQYLPKVTMHSQLVLFPMVHELRKCKMNLNLTPHVYTYFLQHLRHGNYSLVLQNLNRYFTIKTSNAFNAGQYIDENEGTDDETDTFQSNSIICSAAEQNAIDNLQKSITEMKKCTKLIRPSICLYSFVNAYQGLSASSFSNNNAQLAGGFEDSSVRIWNLASKGKIESNLVEGDKYSETSSSSSSVGSSNDMTILRGHHGPVYQTKFFPKDDFLISCSQDKSIRLWNLQSKKGVVDYRGHAYSIWDVAVNVAGTYFVSSSLDRTLRLWNTEYACPLRIYAGHNESVDCVAFHPNGNYIASGSSDKSCRLWDVQSGQFVRVFVGHKAPIYSLAFSHDGKYLVSAGEDSDIKVWDLSNGQILNEVNSHSKTIYSLAFSDDSSMLASGGLDKSIIVWESELLLKKKNTMFKSTFDYIGSYRTNSSNIFSLKFSTGNLLYASCLADSR